jgi:diguanylate cyclase (GGDEF)-like protein/PAS domain S-box-containing protein
VWHFLPKNQGDELDYESLKRLCDDFPLGILLCDETGRCLYTNNAYTKILGYASEQILDQNWQTCMNIEDAAKLKAKWQKAVLERTSLQDDVRLLRADGTMIWTRLHAAMLDTAYYSFASLLMVEDISERKAMEEVLQQIENALFEEKERAMVTLDSIGDAVLTTNLAGNITYLNREAERLTGWDRLQAIGKPLLNVFNIIDGESRGTAPNPANKAMLENRTVELASGCILIAQDGSEFEIEDSAAPIHNRDRQVTGAVIVFHNVTKSAVMMEKTNRLAWYDYLTGLPNLALFNERLSQSIGMAYRHNKRVALLFLDMDDFKKLNDTYGHLTGDHLLKSVAERITQCIRTTDTVCRRSGDEFLILLGEIELPEDAVLVARQILSAIAVPQRVDDNDITLAASIGISVYPDDGLDVTTLMTCADRFMYLAKENGPNQFYYSGSPHTGKVEP